MALTRKLLKSMGIDEDKVEQIIDEHVETVNGLKREIEKHSGDADRLAEVQRELDSVRAELESKGTDAFKDKYESEHKAFEEFKAQVEKERADAEKGTLYRALLRDAGVDERRIESILRVTDLDGVTVKDGAIEGADELTEGIKSEWSDFIKSGGQRGADVDHPPAGSDSITKEAFEAMPLSKRMEYANQHPAEVSEWI